MSARDDYPFPAAVADGRINGGLHGQDEMTAALDEIDHLRSQATRNGAYISTRFGQARKVVDDIRALADQYEALLDRGAL